MSSGRNSFRPNRDEPILFDELPFDWEAEWQGMPEYRHGDLTEARRITVLFKTHEDAEAFAKLVEQKITPLTKTIWFPKATVRGYGRTA